MPDLLTLVPACRITTAILKGPMLMRLRYAKLNPGSLTQVRHN